MNVYDLNDRVAIVTGGAQGIGLRLPIASWPRAAGCHLGPRPGLLDETVKALDAGGRVSGLAVDIADLAAVEAAT